MNADRIGAKKNFWLDGIKIIGLIQYLLLELAKSLIFHHLEINILCKRTLLASVDCNAHLYNAHAHFIVMLSPTFIVAVGVIMEVEVTC